MCNYTWRCNTAEALLVCRVLIHDWLSSAWRASWKMLVVWAVSLRDKIFLDFFFFFFWLSMVMTQRLVNFCNAHTSLHTFLSTWVVSLRVPFSGMRIVSSFGVLLCYEHFCFLLKLLCLLLLRKCHLYCVYFVIINII